MIKKIIFKKIKFLNIKENEFTKIIKKRGLFLFPSGPNLADLNKNFRYHKSLKHADVNFFNSGYFVLLLRYFKNINVKKFSGYLFTKLFLNYLNKSKKKITILSVDANKKQSISNKKLFLIKGINQKFLTNYVAPIYKSNNIVDIKLLQIIKKKRPKYIIIHLGGGVQEILGLYLKENLNYKPTIICTGAAISFFTGNQAPLKYIFDKNYLGWLIRIIYNPRVFLPRYLKAFKLFYLILNNKVIIKY